MQSSSAAAGSRLPLSVACGPSHHQGTVSYSATPPPMTTYNADLAIAVARAAVEGKTNGTVRFSRV